MYIPKADRTSGEDEWRSFVDSHRFGHLIAVGNGLEYPVVVPTQFVLDGWRVLFHVAVGNPVLHALAGDARAVMSVAGDWAFVPSAWKAIGDEDPLLGIPTTYYGAVQIRGRAEVVDDPEATAQVLRQQLAVLQPDVPVADPLEAHATRLKAIRAVVLAVDEVFAKFKYGGNVDIQHRRKVMERLRLRGGPGDLAAAAHVERRIEAETS